MLWCQREDALIEFEIAVCAPYKNDDVWQCNWSLGLLYDRQPCPAIGISSMHALACAQVGISTYLRSRQKAGDRFFMSPDSTDEDLMEDLDLFLPRLITQNEEA